MQNIKIMETITQKSYPDICKTCNGKGKLADNINTTDIYRTCPVCNGTGIITIIETTTYSYETPEKLKSVIKKDSI